MFRLSSHAVKQNFGNALRLARRKPVMIHKYNRDAAVLVSKADFAEYERLRLEDFRARLNTVLNDLESANPQQVATLIKSLAGLLTTAPQEEPYTLSD